jgi:hypothetical protein
MKELATKKLYYKVFDRRLVVNCQITEKDKKLPTQEVITWLMNRKYSKADWRGIQTSSGQWHTHFSWKTNSIHFTVFFKDEQVFEYLKSVIGEENFVEYEKPLNSNHAKVLDSEKVIIRKKLFFDKFRYAVRVKARLRNGSYSTEHIREMSEWCRDYFKDRPNDYSANVHFNATYFFNDPKDVMMFKLSHDEIHVTERITLIDEIEKPADDQ